MKISEYMIRVGVPAKFVGASLHDLAFFDSLTIQKKEIDRYKAHYKRCIKIVNDRKFGILFQGIPGSGKSFMGAAVMREYLHNGVKCARTTTGEILDWYFQDYQGFRERYIQADVLFIDDFTKMGFQTDANLQIMERLVRMREDNQKITMFACFSENDIISKFSKDFHRLVMGTVIHLALPDIDLRQEVLNQPMWQLVTQKGLDSSIRPKKIHAVTGAVLP